MMKSIAIYNNKGGCGKSTSVINLAYEFSAYGKVLVMDTDGQSNTSRFFIGEPKDGLEKVLTGKGKMPRAEKTRYAYLDVISATAAINNAASRRKNNPRLPIRSSRQTAIMITLLLICRPL